MKFGPGQRLVLTLLALILGIQLSGLSCLDELRALSLDRGSTLFSQATNSPTLRDSPADDGCPCHLAFVFTGVKILQASGPVDRTILPVLATAPLAYPALPFRPPLSL